MYVSSYLYVCNVFLPVGVWSHSHRFLDVGCCIVTNWAAVGGFLSLTFPEKQCLISTEECDGSDFSKEEVDHFLKCEIEEFKSPMVEEQQSAEDLIADL